MKSAEIWMGYFKQGDDFATHLEENKDNPIESFKSYWVQISGVLNQIEEITDILKKHEDDLAEISMDADTHMISISGPDKLIDELVKKELAQEMEFEDEEA